MQCFVLAGSKDSENRRHTALQILAMCSTWLRFAPCLKPISPLLMRQHPIIAATKKRSAIPAIPAYIPAAPESPLTRNPACALGHFRHAHQSAGRAYRYWLYSSLRNGEIFADTGRDRGHPSRHRVALIGRRGLRRLAMKQPGSSADRPVFRPMPALRAQLPVRCVVVA